MSAATLDCAAAFELRERSADNFLDCASRRGQFCLRKIRERRKHRLQAEVRYGMGQERGCDPRDGWEGSLGGEALDDHAHPLRQMVVQRSR